MIRCQSDTNCKTVNLHGSRSGFNVRRDFSETHVTGQRFPNNPVLILVKGTFDLRGSFNQRRIRSEASSVTSSGSRRAIACQPVVGPHLLENAQDERGEARLGLPRDGDDALHARSLQRVGKA